MRIALDAMGGDRAPVALVEGAVAAARDLGLAVLLVGDRGRLQAELGRLRVRGLEIEIVDASEVVGMGDAPTLALRQADSSLMRALRLVRDGDAAAMVTAGNTGAAMVVGAHVLGRAPGVERPAIAVRLPAGDSDTILLDAGANVDVRPTHLVQFALMGEAYVRVLRHVAAPRVGLLSNGTEDGKGSAAVRGAAPILSRLPINYVGPVEGHALFDGVADVVVCDGFAGNAVLKGVEGFGRVVRSRLGDALRSGVGGRIAGLLLRRRLAALATELDPASTGGALLVGLGGTLVKAHGGSNARAIRNALALAADLSGADVTGEIGRSLAAQVERIAEIGQVEPPGAGARARSVWQALRRRLRRSEHADSNAPAPASSGEEPSKEETVADPRGPTKEQE